jgi:uncharacterized membrane protein
VGTVLIIIAAVIVGLIVLAITVYFISNKVRARRKAAKAETEARAVIEKKWAQGVAVHDDVYDSWTRFLFPETLGEPLFRSSAPRRYEREADQGVR